MSLNRRHLLKLACSGGALILVACDGDDTSSKTPDGSPRPAWPVPELSFVEGSGSTFDLASTLPVGVEPGGTFALEASSAPLPSGMTLAPTGILSVGMASAGSVSGVVFAYTEPA